jgi:oxygen-independent coproporphyrinogen III oxidase
MAGLYVHIPFCRQKCHYCNFFSLATLKYRDQIFDTLLQEMQIQSNYLHGEKLETIYIGGGTPSLFDPQQIEELIRNASVVLGMAGDPEITIEANPDDMTPQWLEKLACTSVNRLSIGVQSFHDEDLNYLNRVHSGSEALQVVKRSKQFGFDNLSIDLIYGIPTLTGARWEENLQIAINMDIPHISAYALTVEPGTALDHFIRKGKVRPVDDDTSFDHFSKLVQHLTHNGFEHYEISNFAKPGKYARHNTSYWLGAKYLGVGPSAHSYDHASRQWNVANIKTYLQGIGSGKPDFEKETLTEKQKINEYIMTSLRTMWGLDLRKIENEFGVAVAGRLSENASQLIKSGRLLMKRNCLYLTEKGKFFADGIASDMFFEENPE